MRTDFLILILGNMFGLFCGLFCILSTFAKDRKNIMKLQCLDCISGILSCIVLSGFSGAVTQTVSLTRNIFVYKNKTSKYLQAFFVILIIFLASCSIIEGYWGFFQSLQALNIHYVS